MTAAMFQRPVRRRRAALLALALLGALDAVACGRGDAAAKPATEPGAKGAPAAASKDSTAAKAGGAAHGDRAEVVVLDTAGIRLGGIQVATADTITTSGLALTGAITYDADRVTYIGARTAGRVLTVAAELGAQVARGTTLVELESVDVGQIRAEERQAVALLGIARENYTRERRLEQQGISSRKELLDAEAEVRRNEAALRSARDRLAVLGAGHGTGGHFDVSAPFSGVVVTRSVSRGQMAEPTDTLFTVADLSRVWIELNIFERDLARVRTGQSVSVTTDAYPGRTFPGRIVYVAAVLDPATRTVRARVAIPNPDRALKPGMFARAVVQVGGAGPRVVVVPRDALQELRGRQVVFVPGARPGEFRPVPVEVGEAVDGNRVVIRRGLAPGARVVTAGGFALRSELLKSEIGEEGE